MAVFEYEAYKASGKKVKGLIEAESSKGATQKLRTQQIFVTQIVETDAKAKISKGFNIEINFKSSKVSIGDLGLMTRQFATLITAGMPLVESLRALSDQIENSTLKTSISSIADAVNEGSNLANAMRKYPKVFPKLYVNMIGSGEASGSLDMVLGKLADLLEGQAALRRKVFSALTYPLLMLVLCFCVVILLLIYVVPQITAIFEDQKTVLPLPTRMVMGLSTFVQGYWWLIFIMIFAVFFGFNKYAKTPKGRKKLDGILLRLPLIGKLNLKIAVARFASNLGAMLSSGIELLTAMSITKNIVGNLVIEELLAQASEGVREGKSLAAELQRAKIFPKLLTSMIAIGEASGQLENMLLRAGANYEAEVDAIVSGLSAILEPAMILFLAVIVGTILAAVMLPMVQMTTMMG